MTSTRPDLRGAEKALYKDTTEIDLQALEHLPAVGKEADFGG